MTRLTAGNLAACVSTALVIFLPLNASEVSDGIAVSVFLTASGAMESPASTFNFVTPLGWRSHATTRSRLGPSIGP